MKQGACYIRVSTDDQLEYSPDAQLREIQKYAKSNDIIINKEHIFIDEGITGRSAKKRPGFNKMIGTAKQDPRPFDVILLWKFSRFARNQEESIVYKSLLRRQGVEIISVSEPLADGPFGTLIERIIEWMDEYYSIRLSGEVTRGMTEKALRGGFQTGAPFGYVKRKGENAIDIHEPEAKWVRYMFQRFADNGSFYKIAKELNAKGIKTKKGYLFENRTVEYIINNPVYIGYLRWTPTGQTVGKRIYDDPNTITKKGEHPPIISQELWDQCQEIIQGRKATRKPYDRPAETKKHWIVGLLKCGTCGRSLSYNAANNGFQCIGYAHNLCPRSHFVGLPKIEKMVFTALEEIQNNKEYLENIKIITNKDDEIEDIEKQIVRMEHMLERAKTAYLEGLDTKDEYAVNKKKINADIASLKAEKAAIKQDSPADVPQMQKKIHSTIELLQDPSIEHEKKYNAIRDIVEKIAFKRPEEAVNIYLYRRA